MYSTSWEALFCSRYTWIMMNELLVEDRDEWGGSNRLKKVVGTIGLYDTVLFCKNSYITPVVLHDYLHLLEHVVWDDKLFYCQLLFKWEGWVDLRRDVRLKKLSLCQPFPDHPRRRWHTRYHQRAQQQRITSSLRTTNFLM